MNAKNYLVNYLNEHQTANKQFSDQYINKYRGANKNAQKKMGEYFWWKLIYAHWEGEEEIINKCCQKC